MFHFISTILNFVYVHLRYVVNCQLSLKFVNERKFDLKILLSILGCLIYIYSNNNKNTVIEYIVIIEVYYVTLNTRTMNNSEYMNMYKRIIISPVCYTSVI